MANHTSREDDELRYRRMKAAEMADEKATFKRIQSLANKLVTKCGELRWGDGTAESMALEQVMRAVARTGVDDEHRAASAAHSARSPESKRKPISNGVRREVWDRDNWMCVACGSHKNLTVDHIHPVSLGGTNDFDNLQTMCGSCNSRKGARVDGS